jgi:hypothetical protein
MLWGKNGRSLRVAFVHIVISLTAVVFFVIVLILVWFFPKKDIASGRVIRTVCVEALWTYYAHIHMLLCAVLRRFRWAAIPTGLLLECGVLAVNGGRCPLSDSAQRLSDSHANNFDIYLPNWLAQYNKVIGLSSNPIGSGAILNYFLHKWQILSDSIQ